MVILCSGFRIQAAVSGLVSMCTFGQTLQSLFQYLAAMLSTLQEITESYDLTEITISDVADVEVVSSGETPISLGLTEAPADWESLESVLISLDNVTIGSGPDEGYGVYPINEYPVLTSMMSCFATVFKLGTALRALPVWSIIPMETLCCFRDEVRYDWPV